jgi:hypothetical protein
MTERMLKFVGTSQAMPDKRPAAERRRDFDEIYANYAREKAADHSYQKINQALHHREELRSHRRVQRHHYAKIAPGMLHQNTSGECLEEAGHRTHLHAFFTADENRLEQPRLDRLGICDRDNDLVHIKLLHEPDEIDAPMSAAG